VIPKVPGMATAAMQWVGLVVALLTLVVLWQTMQINKRTEART
jgi:hypothetical protein